MLGGALQSSRCPAIPKKSSSGSSQSSRNRYLHILQSGGLRLDYRFYEIQRQFRQIASIAPKLQPRKTMTRIASGLKTMPCNPLSGPPWVIAIIAQPGLQSFAIRTIASKLQIGCNPDTIQTYCLNFNEIAPIQTRIAYGFLIDA